MDLINGHLEKNLILDGWLVYIVRCQNNALYTGMTNDILNRIKKHNSGKGSKSVRAHGIPVHLVWSQKVSNRSEALKLEYYIKKRTKKRKEYIVKWHLPITMENIKCL
jgi:putative endonuclease